MNKTGFEELSQYSIAKLTVSEQTQILKMENRTIPVSRAAQQSNSSYFKPARNKRKPRKSRSAPGKRLSLLQKRNNGKPRRRIRRRTTKPEAKALRTNVVDLRLELKNLKKENGTWRKICTVLDELNVLAEGSAEKLLEERELPKKSPNGAQQAESKPLTFCLVPQPMRDRGETDITRWGTGLQLGPGKAFSTTDLQFFAPPMSDHDILRWGAELQSSRGNDSSTAHLQSDLAPMN